MLYYNEEIKEMMEISKKTGKPVISIFNNETISVQYSEQYEEYTFKYSWIITDEEDKIGQKVSEKVTKILLSSSNYAKIVSNTPDTFDVVKMGLITFYDTSTDRFIELIKLANKRRLNPTRNTNYIFFGKKVLSVTQYHGIFSNPFECLGGISNWDHSDLKQVVGDNKLIKLARGIYCVHSIEDENVVFSIGNKYIKTVFSDEVIGSIPPLLCIDSFNGITEVNIGDLTK